MILLAHHLGRLLKEQLGGDNQTEAFIGPADDLEELFRSGFGERDVAELFEDEQSYFALLMKNRFRSC